MKVFFIGLICCFSYLFLLDSNSRAFFDQNSSLQRDMDSTAISSIHISQVSFDATQHTNEFGYRTGWIELVNNSDEAICLRADCWSISNDRAIAALYFIRNDVVIKANGNIIVWCDNLNAVQANLHTNFKLNKENGRVELYHINEKQDFERVDFLDYKEVVKTIATVE